jgi:hypothetical protein
MIKSSCKNKIVEFASIVILVILFSCDLPRMSPPVNVVNAVEKNDTAINLFLDFYYDMSYANYRAAYNSLRDNYPQNINANENLVFEANDMNLIFAIRGSIYEDKIKAIILDLIAEKKAYNLSKNSRKEVIILTGNKIEVLQNNTRLYLPEYAKMNSNISDITIGAAKEYMASKHGIVPEYEPFARVVVDSDPNSFSYAASTDYYYFVNGTKIVDKLIATYTDKYSKPKINESNSINLYSTGHRLKSFNNIYPQINRSNRGDIIEIRYLRSIKSRIQEYIWLTGNKEITIEIMRDFIDNQDLITKINITYKPHFKNGNKSDTQIDNTSRIISTKKII